MCREDAINPRQAAAVEGPSGSGTRAASAKCWDPEVPWEALRSEFARLWSG